MVAIVIIDKAGTVKSSKITNENDLTQLYKKAGFKTVGDFEVRTSWKLEISKTKYEIELYARKKGRAGQENKYEFPPPVDNDLYFGSCVLINKKGDLTTEMWENIYSELYGGFEDLGEDDSDSEDCDDDTYEKSRKTKSGYVEDGFVVDDNDGLTEEDSKSGSESELDSEKELSEEDYL